MANPVQINDSLFTAGLVLSAQEARTGLASLVARDGSGARLGVFYEGTQALITGTATTAPSMQVSVSPLAFCGQKASGEGVYVGRSVGTVLVDVAAAPASNSRIDTVYVMQRDANSTTSPDGLTQGEVGVVTGTAAVSPTAPAAPAGAVVVGTVTVAAGVTATTNAGCTVATTCQWTSGAGSPIPVRNSTEQGALTAFDGLRAYRLDLHVEKVYNGTSWDRAFADFYRGVGGTIPTGTATLLAFPNQVNLEGGMTYSAGLFTVPVSGRYECATNIMFPGAAGQTQIGAQIYVNGSLFAFAYANGGTVSNWSSYILREIRLNAGDQVSFYAFHNSTAALATSADIHSTFAQVGWIGS